MKTRYIAMALFVICILIHAGLIKNTPLLSFVIVALMFCAVMKILTSKEA